LSISLLRQRSDIRRQTLFKTSVFTEPKGLESLPTSPEMSGLPFT
jgi:hypothetical protein